MADPTLDTLAKLDDPTLYVKVENVPIFRPHERQGKDGKPVKVDVERLGKIAAKINRKTAESGDMPRLIPGHTKPGAPQKDQPSAWGFAKDARVGTFGPGNVPGILATFYVSKERWEECKQYPYRSPEFYAATDEITAVAFLKTDPELDLGVLTYERSDGGEYVPLDLGPLRYNVTADDLDDNDPMLSRVLRYMQKCYPRLKDMHEQYAAGFPGPMNTGVPTMSEAKKPDQLQKSAEVLQYEKQVADLTAANAEQAKRMADLEKQNRLIRYERDLTALREQGYQLDLAEELKDLSDATPEQFERHKKRIVERYQRAPIGQAIRQGEIDHKIPGQAKGMTEEQMGEALQYCRENPGVPWEQAVVKVTKKAG